MSKEQVTQHYISVMQAFIAGENIEVREKVVTNGRWAPAGAPAWNFGDREYRIKPKSKPTVDWSALHPSIQCIARDSNGNIFGYSSRPVIRDERVWAGLGGIECKRLDNVIASLTPGDCDWQDSLVARP